MELGNEEENACKYLRKLQEDAWVVLLLRGASIPHHGKASYMTMYLAYLFCSNLILDSNLKIQFFFFFFF